MKHKGFISTVFSDNEAFLYSDNKLAYYANILSINGLPSTMMRLRNLAGKYIRYKVVKTNHGVSDIAINIQTTANNRSKKLF